MIGRTLSHYKVLEEISRGGMGIVYKALDLKLNREVALKVLPPELVADPDRKHRFVQEAQAAAALHLSSFFPVLQYPSSVRIPIFSRETRRCVCGVPLGPDKGGETSSN